MLAVLLAGAVGVTAYYTRRTIRHTQLHHRRGDERSGGEPGQATGTLQAVTTVEVGSQVSGTISSLHADFNSRVRKGQVLARLEPSLFQTQVEQAEATVQRLQADVERAVVEVEDARRSCAGPSNWRPAADRGQRSRHRAHDCASGGGGLKSARAQVAQARAAVNQSRVNLGHATITAPVDGIVVSRNVDVGQTVAASMQAPTLFVIAEDLARMQVNASVDESDIGQIQPGQQVTFQVDAYPDEVFTGSVRQVRLNPVVEQNVVSYVTVIDVPNPELKLKPGMTANVRVQIARADDALRVPNAALRFRPDPEVLQARGGAARLERDTGQRAARPADGSAVWVLTEAGLRRTAVQTGSMTAPRRPSPAATCGGCAGGDGCRCEAARAARWRLAVGTAAARQKWSRERTGQGGAR